MNRFLCGGLVTASAFVLLSCNAGEAPTAPTVAAVDVVPTAALHQLDGGRIALHSCCADGAEGPLDVFVFDFTQGGFLPLPGLNDPQAEDFNASLSADGNLVAFTSDRSGQGDVFLYDIAAGSLVPLPGLNRPGAFDGDPSISGSGRFIAFESERAGAGNVFLYDRNAASLVALPQFNSRRFHDGDPSLSDDARFLAFFSDRGGAGNVFLYDRNRQKIVGVPGLNSRSALDDQPGISGDGDLIAFRSFRREGTGDLFLYHTNSRVLDHFPIEQEFLAEPTLSFDGALLLFSLLDPEAEVDDSDVWAFDRRAGVVDRLAEVNDDNPVATSGPALNVVTETG